jgi:hypothetical protein
MSAFTEPPVAATEHSLSPAVPGDAEATETIADIPAATGRPWVFRLESPAGVGVLEAVSLFYVGIPTLIFFFGWLRLPLALVLAIPFAFLIARGAFRAVAWARNAYAGAPPPDASMDNETLTFCALLLLGMVAFAVACTGVGGLTFRFSDYWMYDGLLRMLIEYPWPPGMILNLPQPDAHLPLVGCISYYLPAALVGRALGWEAAQFFSYLWNTLGTLLAVIWFLRIVGVFRLRYALLFLFFNGVDLVGYALTTPLPDGRNVTWLDYATGTFWWSIGRGWMAHWSANFSLLTPDGQSMMGGVFYRFYGMLSFLFDGTSHVLPAWVLLFVVLHDVLRRKTLERVFLLTSLLPLCSVFVTLGTIPILIVSAVQTRGRKLFTPGNVVVGPVIVLVSLLCLRGIEFQSPNGWVWNFLDVNRTWGYLFLYYFCGFILYALVAPSMRGNDYRPGRLWFYSAIAAFVFAPWYHMGLFNDFTTKMVIPSQLVFLICLATALRNPEGKGAQLRRGLLATALVVGAWSGLGVIYRAVDFGFSLSPPPQERAEYFADQFGQAMEDKSKLCEAPIFFKDTFFWNWLARPVTYFRHPENKTVLSYDFRDPADNADAWRYCDNGHRTTGDGLVIETPGNTALLMREDVDLDTRAIGSAIIDNTVVDEQGNTPNYEIGFQWADADQLRNAQSKWPFHRWCYNAAYPRGNHLTYNPYWRGRVRAISLYLKVKGEPGKHYTVTLRRLTFLQR